ncbi:Ger(x)C family spore germination protein [Gracilibacillus timonensis]|uniref:Ger(x)C family spore germination protein n=1 Tax=Gracilibacillus timonensis TaxID=1816696 RepID=UPI000825AB21|nr:Ger(x)C family spore germination protein [Gracilibacillus timonensis]
MSYAIKCLSFVLYCCFLTGCWSANELTDISLATSLAIDKDEQGYMVTIQVLNPNEIAGDKISNRATVSSYSAVGETMFEAVRKLTETSPRKVNLSHLQLIVYGEELARDGIGKTLDLLLRDHELRTDFNIIVAKGTRGKELISILTPLERIPATKIKTSLESSQNFLASTKVVQLSELVESISAEGKEAVLNSVYVEGDTNFGPKIENAESGTAPTKLLLDGIGVFSDDKLQGWLSTNEGKGYNFITDNITSTSIQTNCGESGKLALEVTSSKTKLKGMWKDGTPQIGITINLEANIADAECVIDLTKEENILALREGADKSIKALVETSILTAKEYESDIFGFGEVMKRSHPKIWDKIKGDWPSHFSNLTVDIEVSTEIKNAGIIAQPIYDAVQRKKQQKEGN